jgi:hypothetical protein
MRHRQIGEDAMLRKLLYGIGISYVLRRLFGGGARRGGYGRY